MITTPFLSIIHNQLLFHLRLCLLICIIYPDFSLLSLLSLEEKVRRGAEEGTRRKLREEKKRSARWRERRGGGIIIISSSSRGGDYEDSKI